MLSLDRSTGGEGLAGTHGVPMGLVPARGVHDGGDMADDEKPRHHVYLNAFYMDKYEMTVEQYAKYLEATDMEGAAGLAYYASTPTSETPGRQCGLARCCHVLQMGRQAAADGG